MLFRVIYDSQRPLQCPICSGFMSRWKKDSWGTWFRCNNNECEEDCFGLAPETEYENLEFVDEIFGSVFHSAMIIELEKDVDET